MTRWTRLEDFLKANGIKPVHFARESGVSRQHIMRLRLGTMEPTRHMMVVLATAAWRILRRRVAIEEMFDLSIPHVTLPLVMVNRVTPKHGEAFARLFVERVRDSTDVFDALTLTGIITSGPNEDESMRLRREAIENEITRRALDLAKPALAKAFVVIANQVLDRERRTRE
jgi:hypothetical protein